MVIREKRKSGEDHRLPIRVVVNILFKYSMPKNEIACSESRDHIFISLKSSGPWLNVWYIVAPKQVPKIAQLYVFAVHCKYCDEFYSTLYKDYLIKNFHNYLEVVEY